MKKITNPDFLKAVICFAAEEAYTSEVLAADEEETLIGEGKEFSSVEDWQSVRIKTWNEEVAKKLKVFGVKREIEVDESSIAFANQYYNAILGETIKLEGVEMTRIPGGWLVISEQPDGLRHSFVPYSKEFSHIIAYEIDAGKQPAE